VTVTLRSSKKLIDGSTPNRDIVEIAPGVYDLERIPNPYGHKHDWYALKGTKIGGTIAWWRSWASGAEDLVELQE
jgi:hypothetical protein